MKSVQIGSRHSAVALAAVLLLGFGSLTAASEPAPIGTGVKSGGDNAIAPDAASGDRQASDEGPLEPAADDSTDHSPPPSVRLTDQAEDAEQPGSHRELDAQENAGGVEGAHFEATGSEDLEQPRSSSSSGVPLREQGATPAPAARLDHPTDFQALSDEEDAERLLENVYAASFLELTPGVSSRADIVQKLGEPISEQRRDQLTIIEFRRDGLDKLEVALVEDQVLMIILHLEEPADVADVERQLDLDQFQPAPVPDEDQEVLGYVYPERAVMLVFAGQQEQPEVTQVILEPLTSESFVLRAEHEAGYRYTKRLRDLDRAAALNPEDPRCFWKRAQIHATIGNGEHAMRDIQHALAIHPNVEFQLTLAELHMQRDEYREAERILRQAAGSATTELQRARMEYLSGKVLARGPRHEYKAATEHYLKAMELAGTVTAKADTRQASHLVLHCHLAMAQAIAWGNWKRKDEISQQWLESAAKLADTLIERSVADVEARLWVAQAGLEVLYGLTETDPTEWTEQAIDLGRQLIADAADPLYRQKLEWALGEALFYAASIEHRRGENAKSRHYANNAYALLSSLEEHDQLTPQQRFLLGRLHFLIGAQYSIVREDHREAVVWFQRALPWLEPTPPACADESAGLHGERFVSMGVSFWRVDEQSRAVELTERGLELIRQAVEAKQLDQESLYVPYNNLAAMHEQMGNHREASRYGRFASQLESGTDRATLPR